MSARAVPSSVRVKFTSANLTCPVSRRCLKHLACGNSLRRAQRSAPVGTGLSTPRRDAEQRLRGPAEKRKARSSRLSCASCFSGHAGRSPRPCPRAPLDLQLACLGIRALPFPAPVAATVGASGRVIRKDLWVCACAPRARVNLWFSKGLKKLMCASGSPSNPRSRLR